MLMGMHITIGAGTAVRSAMNVQKAAGFQLYFRVLLLLLFTRLWHLPFCDYRHSLTFSKVFSSLSGFCCRATIGAKLSWAFGKIHPGAITEPYHTFPWQTKMCGAHFLLQTCSSLLWFPGSYYGAGKLLCNQHTWATLIIHHPCDRIKAARASPSRSSMTCPRLRDCDLELRVTVDDGCADLKSGHFLSLSFPVPPFVYQVFTFSPLFL